MTWIKFRLFWKPTQVHAQMAIYDERVFLPAPPIFFSCTSKFDCEDHYILQKNKNKL